MKKFVIILMAFVLFAGMAMAEKPVFEKPLAPNSYTPNGRAAEVEDNGTPATANPLTVGDDMSAAIASETDEDFFSFAATGGVEYVFETNPGDVVDTVMYLYDTDGVTELTSDDDGGAGL